MVSQRNSALISLLASRTPGFSASELQNVINKVGDEAIIANPENCPHGAFKAKLLDRLSRDAALRDIERWETEGILVTGVISPLYPARLKEIYNPPCVLFSQGTWPDDLDAIPMIGVVGSRSSDSTGGQIAHSLSAAIVESGGCVVSGLALGIDSHAHRGALQGKGRLPTIAVLGNGLPGIYPSSNRRLAQDILERGGLLLSQFEPSIPPYPSNFLNRNRIIAGLSIGVLVVQAAARSGSLSTARYALEEGREVMAIPGGVLDPRASGTNALLKQGATLVTTIEDICNLFPILKHDKKKSSCAGPQGSCYELIAKSGTLTVEELVVGIGDRAKVEEELLILELAGEIIRLPGNYVSTSLK